MASDEEVASCDILFIHTPMLRQNFTPVISARNLRVTFDIDNNKNFRQHISETFHCAFIIFVTFIVFAGICLLLSPKLLQMLLLGVDLTFIIPFITTSQGYLETLTRAKLFGKGSYPVSSFLSLSTTSYLNHCIGSLSDIALFLRSVQLPIKHFHPSKKHIYIHCSLLQDSPDSFDHLILIYFLFPVLRQILELEHFQLLHRLCGTHSLLVLSM